MNVLLTPVLWAVFAAVPLAEENPVSPEQSAGPLAGTYQILSSEKSGAASPKEKIDGVVVVFTKDKIVATNRENDEVYAATFQIDSTQMPHHITMVSVMENSKGVKAK